MCVCGVVTSNEADHPEKLDSDAQKGTGVILSTLMSCNLIGVWER